MGRDHVAIAEDGLDGIAEMIVAPAARITFVAFHDRSPLFRGHCSSTRIGEQINQYVIGGKQKQVVVRRTQVLFALPTRCPPDGFDTLNSKGLNDRPGHGALHLQDTLSAEYVSVIEVTQVTSQCDLRNSVRISGSGIEKPGQCCPQTPASFTLQVSESTRSWDLRFYCPKTDVLVDRSIVVGPLKVPAAD